jgi:hypothetical protein
MGEGCKMSVQEKTKHSINVALHLVMRSCSRVDLFMMLINPFQHDGVALQQRLQLLGNFLNKIQRLLKGVENFF